MSFRVRILFILTAFLMLSTPLSFGRVKNKAEKLPLIQKGNFCISAGYGFPSTIRFFLKNLSKHNGTWVEGSGPFLLKTEYLLHKRWGIGLNASYNKTQVAWMDLGWDPSINKNRPYEYGFIGTEFSIAVRGNYHFKSRGRFDSYVGGGLGYGRVHLRTYTLAPVNQFYTQFTFPKPFRVELTGGARYYFNRHIGIFTELGLGNMWILFKQAFVPEGIIQGGVCIKL